MPALPSTPPLVGEVDFASWAKDGGGPYTSLNSVNLEYMHPKYELARKMRRELTRPEFLLWERIKSQQVGLPVFRRQYALGPYILDFYCIRARMAVEVDGQQHGLDDVIARDEKRDAWLRSQGVEVYRTAASEVLRDVGEVADGIYDLAMARLNGL